MNNEPGEDQITKQRLLRSARMYAMCQKAKIDDPELPVALALAAFEEMPLPEASAFVRTNRPSLEDMAWALVNSSSTEEFEQKLRERISTISPRQGEPGGRQGSSSERSAR